MFAGATKQKADVADDPLQSVISVFFFFPLDSLNFLTSLIVYSKCSVAWIAEKDFQLLNLHLACSMCAVNVVFSTCYTRTCSVLRPLFSLLYQEQFDIVIDDVSDIMKCYSCYTAYSRRKPSNIVEYGIRCKRCYLKLNKALANGDIY